ncbi:uncharacterized protein EAE97_005800 [Botrytis byssoidea]|uniref:Uncharacterized protein n=1 Tax=Botrytis byssoidea TaxID=139641 RepID=A0A9P5IN82_9HELO|nr:uncharacterized protein EAE97_005800 [Botrytis byssoidea]KAF7943730.1 hypothetical protein EAE97_005800 [Botrytis byssoidea]
MPIGHANRTCQLDMPFEGGKIWQRIVELYMKGNLTFKTDRLVAIGGLANAAAQHIGGKYLAGVWEKDLLYGILWSAQEYPFHLSNFTEAPLEKHEYTAPSWSWASFSAEIKFPSKVYGSEVIEQFSQILETRLELAIDNPFGKVCGGYIKLKGDITSAKWCGENFSGRQFLNGFELCFGRDRKEWGVNIGVLFICDFEDMTGIELHEIYLLPVCRFHYNYGRWEVGGLILFPTNRVRWEFRRRGIFRYYDDKEHETMMSECSSFSREQEIESPELGLQDDGQLIIKIF